MPARIDPEARRQHVVAAAFRLIVAQGMSGLTLRKVADEAGLNIGSVRHYFDDYEDLLTAAAQSAGDRMGVRLLAHPAAELRGLAGDDALDGLQVLLEQVLPVDDARREETVVLQELIVASRTRPILAPVAAQMADDLHAVVEEALTALGVPDPSTSTRSVTALIGGLALASTTAHGSISVEELRGTLRNHLERLQIAHRH